MLILLLLPTVFCLTCNKCIINELFNDTECSTPCNGTACWITEYNFQLPQYKGIRAFEMGCLSAPVSFPLGCRYNQAGTYMCICDQDNCNTKELVVNRTSLTIPKMMNCTDTLDWTRTRYCSALLCFSDNFVYPLQGCEESQTQLELVPGATFDLFYSDIYGFIWPAKDCLLTFRDYEVKMKCTTTKQVKTNEVPKFSGNLKCRKSYDDKEDTCNNGTLCFNAKAFTKKEALGCLQQTNVQGIKLVPGAYQFFDSFIYICNTTLCNDGMDAYGKPRNITMEQIEGRFDPFLYDSNVRNEDCCTQPPPVETIGSA